MTASHAHLSAARAEAATAAALLPDAAPLRAAPTGKCPQPPPSFLPLPTNLWPSCDATPWATRPSSGRQPPRVPTPRPPASPQRQWVRSTESTLPLSTTKAFVGDQEGTQLTRKSVSLLLHNNRNLFLTVSSHGKIPRIQTAPSYPFCRVQCHGVKHIYIVGQQISRLISPN